MTKENKSLKVKTSSRRKFFKTAAKTGAIAAAAVAMPYVKACLLYTSPSPRDLSTSRMPSSA